VIGAYYLAYPITSRWLAKPSEYVPRSAKNVKLEELLDSAQRVEQGVPLTSELYQALFHGTSRSRTKVLGHPFKNLDIGDRPVVIATLIKKCRHARIEK